MKFLTLLTALFLSSSAFAGFQGLNGTTSLGVFNKLTCSTGLTCTKVGSAFSIVSSPTISTGSLTIQGAALTSGDLLLNTNAAAANADKWKISADTATDSLIMYNKTSGSYVAKYTLTSGGNATVAGTETVTGAFTPTGGVVASSGQWTNYGHILDSLTGGTDTTPGTTTVYMTQIFVHANATITGVKVLNGSANGTDKYVVALFDSGGTPVANSSTSGITCSGTSAFQTLAFTGTYAAKGPGVYWVGLYVNGTTARFRSLAAANEGKGLAGSVTAQTFGTVAAVTLPTSFTADKGPVAFLY